MLEPQIQRSIAQPTFDDVDKLPVETLGIRDGDVIPLLRTSVQKHAVRIVKMGGRSAIDCSRLVELGAKKGVFTARTPRLKEQGENAILQVICTFAGGD